MILSFRHKIAFICVPKCASTSVEALLEPRGDIVFGGQPELKHLGIREFDQFIRPLLARKVKNLDIETFCIMREPLEWAHSWYRYRARRDLKNPKHPKHFNHTGNIDFDTFIRGTVAEKPSPPSKIGCQSRMILNREGAVAVDRVFDYAQLEQVDEYLSLKLGKRVKLPRINTSQHMRYQLDAELETRFREKYRADFDLYESLD